MKKLCKNIFVFIVLFTFAFSLISEAFYTQTSDEEKGLKLLKEGESLYESFKFDEAIGKYHEAFAFLKSKENLVRFYLDISKAYYATGDELKAEEMLRKMFELDKNKKINPEEVPKGFLRIYYDIRVEYSLEASGPPVKVKEGERKKKKKKTWLLVAGIAAVVGILVYFLFKKKGPSGQDSVLEQYTLTVTKGEGVLGIPESGTHTYNKGHIVEYSYSLEFDYIFYSLIVKLDGENVPASGSIIMDKNHTLSAVAQGFFRLKR